MNHFCLFFLRCFCLRNKTHQLKVWTWFWGGCGDRGLCSCSCFVFFFFISAHCRAELWALCLLLWFCCTSDYSERALGPTDCSLNPAQQLLLPEMSVCFFFFQRPETRRGVKERKHVLIVALFDLLNQKSGLSLLASLTNVHLNMKDLAMWMTAPPALASDATVANEDRKGGLGRATWEGFSERFTYVLSFFNSPYLLVLLGYKRCCGG